MTRNSNYAKNHGEKGGQEEANLWEIEQGASLPAATRAQLARPYDRHGRPLHVDLRTYWKLMSLPRFFEYFISVDHFPIWRRHVVWSKSNGDKVREHMTQRFASNMVFMSLMLSAEIAVLFSPSTVTDVMRQRLFDAEYQTYDFWAGTVLCVSLFLVLCCLVATFTAWAMVSVISDVNAHIVLRSSIGLLATQLPSRLIVMAIYTFFLWLILFMFILVPKYLAILITVLATTLLFFIVSLYSSFGRMIMLTGAMGSYPIMPKEKQEKMLPYQLYVKLVEKATESKAKKISVTTQYRVVPPLDMELGSMSNISQSHHSHLEKSQDPLKAT